MYNRFREALIAMARTSSIPEMNQSSYEKAIAVYRACESIVIENKTDLDAVKEVLANAGLTWPHQSGNADILEATLFLNSKWHLGTFLRVSSYVNTSGALTLNIKPSQLLERCVARRKRLMESMTYEHHFTVLRKDYGSAGKVPISYRDQLDIETILIPELENYLTKAELLVTDSEHVSDFTALVTTERWKNLIQTYYNTTKPVKIIVANRNYFTALFNLSVTFHEGVKLLMGWCMVQMISDIVHGPLILRSFESREKAISQRTMFCFDMTQKGMGYAFNSKYVKQTYPIEVQNEIAKLLKIIRNSLNEVGFMNDLLPPLYANTTGTVLELVEKSSQPRLGRSFEHYSDMTRSIILNWKYVADGFTNSNQDDVTQFPLERDGHILPYKTNPRSRDFTLMPYSATLPLYEKDVLFGLKLGGLGSQVAIALSEIIFQEFDTWDVNAKAMVQRQFRCLLANDERADTMNAFSWQTIHRTLSVGVLLAAFRSEKPNNEPLETLVEFMELSELQLALVFWCYWLCGEPRAEELCNVPLKHSEAFARAFDCSRNAWMSSDTSCAILTLL